MITVANRIYVKPEFQDQFAKRFIDRAGMVDHMPGFVSNYILKPERPGDPYVVLALWESREAFEAWRTAPGFKEGHKGGNTLPPEAFPRPNVLEIHEVIGGSEVGS